MLNKFEKFKNAVLVVLIISCCLAVAVGWATFVVSGIAISIINISKYLYPQRENFIRLAYLGFNFTLLSLGIFAVLAYTQVNYKIHTKFNRLKPLANTKNLEDTVTILEDAFENRLQSLNDIAIVSAKICSNCCHYHNSFYGKYHFCCAMHPSGPNDKYECPDWEEN